MLGHGGPPWLLTTGNLLAFHASTHASQVLLLDEITVDMDVVGRLDLLHFFKQECEERGATIVYVSGIPMHTHLIESM